MPTPRFRTGPASIWLAQQSPAIAGLVLVAFSVFLYGTQQPFLHALSERMEGVAYDLRLQANLPTVVEPDPRVVVVDIDEYSLSKQGQWPWPRTRLAELLHQLYATEAAVIGFDITFPEPEYNLLQTLQQRAPELLERENSQQQAMLQELSRVLDGDKDFSEALLQGQTVLGFSFAPAGDSDSASHPIPLAAVDSNNPLKLAVGSNSQPVANIPILQEAAAGNGFFSIPPDNDGVIRRAPLLARHGDFLYPSLALEVVRQYYGAPPLQLSLSEDTTPPLLEAIHIEGFVDVPVDRLGQAMVPFRGPAGSVSYIPAQKILDGDFDPALLRDAIVLIGTTAAGLSDLRSTPVDEVYPGVEVVANLILGMMDNQIPQVTALTEGIDMAMLIGLGIIFSLLFPRLHPAALISVGIVTIALYLTFSSWLWREQAMVVSQAIPVLLITLLALLNALYGFFIESRSRNRLKSMFGQYVPPALVDEMNQQLNKDFGFQGESREMTVLFCDIRSFTTISETLSANELKQMLNFFFTPMTGEIFDKRGTIDKYVGDMIMAFWGAPLPDPHHRSNAIRAAMAMLDKVDAMAEELQARNWPVIQVGIGLNTGTMNVGDMGSEFRRNYTVIGDAVNLGSRLEGLTKYYGVRLIVSEFTRQENDGFSYRLLDRVRVKGRHEPVAIYEPVGETGKLSDQENHALVQFEQVLADYHQQQWASAAKTLQALREQDPQRKLYTLYQERIEHLATQNLPEDWDGVYTHATK